MNRKTNKTKALARAGVIAALYASLTLLLAPISYGPIQFRLSEALTILPLFYLEAIPGLAIGCFIANVASTPWDMLFGTLATLIAAVLTFLSRKIYFGVLPPIILNALLVPVIFLFDASITEPYFFNVLTVGIGQAVAVIAFGVPLFFGLKSARKRLQLLQ